MTKKAENEFKKLIKSWLVCRFDAECIYETDADDLFDLCRQYSKELKSEFHKFKDDILTDLYIIRASIPLTTGKNARILAKRLIEKLEKIK